MGILSGIFKARDKPVNSTAGSAYRFFMGGSTSGKRVTEQSAMQMTAVYACVRILSESVAGLPIHLYKYTESGNDIFCCPENPDDASFAVGNCICPGHPERKRRSDCSLSADA